MPMSTASHLFESGLATPPATPCLETLIRQHLELASHDVQMTSDAPPSPPQGTSSPDASALVNEMGDYLTRTAMLWAQLTESLLKGQHITRATLEVHEKSRSSTGLSDLSAVAALDVTLGRLRKIRDLTALFSREVQSIWESSEAPAGLMSSSPVMPASSMSPYYEVSSASQSMSGTGDGESRVPKTRKLLPDDPSAPRGGGDASGSDDSDDDDDEEKFASIDMEALRQRGKGTYYCPKGHRCDKGGVDKDGNLVLFDRNSSFAQHCNKHRKPWRCELPGCPNPPKKRRFARRDGLERHKATVKHYLT